MPNENTTNNEQTKRDPPICWRPPVVRRAEFLARVERSGLSVNAFITRAVFRAASRDAAMLARLLNDAAAIRDALYDIARHEIDKAGGDMSGNSHPLETALDDLTELRAAILEALGRRL